MFILKIHWLIKRKIYYCNILNLIEYKTLLTLRFFIPISAYFINQFSILFNIIFKFILPNMKNPSNKVSGKAESNSAFDSALYKIAKNK
jgi:hypothetical protein